MYPGGVDDFFYAYGYLHMQLFEFSKELINFEDKIDDRFHCRLVHYGRQSIIVDQTTREDEMQLMYLLLSCRMVSKELVNHHY